jgi:hypothetical protein
MHASCHRCFPPLHHTTYRADDTLYHGAQIDTFNEPFELEQFPWSCSIFLNQIVPNDMTAQPLSPCGLLSAQLTGISSHLHPVQARVSLFKMLHP